MKTVLINVIIVILSGFASVSAYSGKLPEQLANLPITLFTGEKTSLANYAGKKPVYLKFWATWCQPCMKEMPHFAKIAKQYGDAVEIIGINVGINDDKTTVDAVIKQFGLTMPMTIDTDAALATHFNMKGTPYHLLFDKNLNLVHLGHSASDVLDNKIGLLATSQTIDLLAESPFESEIEQGLVSDNNNQLRAILFSASWCDWYLQDTRPSIAKNCVLAQHQVNSLAVQFADIDWISYLSRLWTTPADLEEFRKKYQLTINTEIDTKNHYFFNYQVTVLPTLIVVRNNQIVYRTSDFTDSAAIVDQLNAIRKQTNQ